MAEKDLESIATVHMKPEYAASDVYSASSEAPPAYKHSSNSVKIAKICAFTVIVSSFIIGSFILASAFVQARASCNEMQALDSVLEKELMLETMQQELPRAEALLGKEKEDTNPQSIDLPDIEKEGEKSEVSEKNNELESDSSSFDSDELDDVQKNQHSIPLELDLSDFAAALLESNQKSHVNCVIERKHAIEMMNSQAQSVQLPFGLNITTDPKKQRITGERISISCDTGSADEKREMNDNVENIRPVFIPLRRVPISFEPQLQQVPITHLPQRMAPLGMMHSMQQRFQQTPMQPPVPPQFMQAPRPEPQFRFHVPSNAIRDAPIGQEIQGDNLGETKSFPRQFQPMPQIHIERVPLDLALQRAGITTDDLRNIQRMAEERITEGLQHLVAEENASNSDDSDSSAEDYSQSSDQSKLAQKLPEPQLALHTPMQEQNIFQIGQNAYERSLPNPGSIPVTMMHLQKVVQPSSDQEDSEPKRPHYVQPRSVRSVDNAFLRREKRVKRCACDCSC